MAGAIHRILLGNQEAAATWLPFAMGQFYACPEGAQTSFTPVPGVTILVKRVGGQDVVQITAGGSPDWVLYDNAVPTTANGPPLVFIPNNPERKPEGPTNAYAARLANIGDGKLFASHGVGLQNDMLQPYVERLTVWNYVSPWYTVIGGKDLESPAAQSVFTVRPVTEVIDVRKEITPGGPRVHRLVAIQGPDWEPTPSNPGGIHVSDDLGATWESYAYPIAPVTGGYWASGGVYRIDIDTLMYVVYLGNRASGMGPELPPYFVRGTTGGLGWFAQNDIDGAPIGIPATISYDLLNAKFYPCKTPGTAIGLATMLAHYVAPPPVYPTGQVVLRTLRTVDSGITFTHYDYVVPSSSTATPGTFHNGIQIGSIGVWFDPLTSTYASLIVKGLPLGNQYGVIYPMMMVTSNDEGLTWQLHPVYDLYNDDLVDYQIDGQGFYNGRFYITFFEQSSGKTSFSYSTNDYGVTWVKHAHSKDAGRGLSSVVQLLPTGKSFPHRLDI